MKTIAVLAGSMEEYMSHKDIFLALEGEKMVYAVTLNKILSNRFDELRTVGTFWERKDADYIYKEVLARTNY